MQQQQDNLHGNSVLMKGASILARLGLSSITDLIPTMALAAAQREMREPLRLWEAHHRRFAYTEVDEREFEQMHATPMGFIGLGVHKRLHNLQWGKYTGPMLRKMRERNGVGRRHAPDMQQRVRINVPWDSSMKPRIVAFTPRIDEKGTPYLGDMKIYRGDGLKSKLRRDRRFESTLDDARMSLIIKAVLAKLASMAGTVAGQRFQQDLRGAAH